jgi:hypothetical protein
MMDPAKRFDTRGEAAIAAGVVVPVDGGRSAESGR